MAFADDILDGLSQNPKRLPSRYFYDQTGDELFSAIMRSKDYYLTDCEHEIFVNEKDRLADAFEAPGGPFDLVEFGAGDGLKTTILLKHLLKRGIDFRFVPIDISGNVLDVLEKKLAAEIPDLAIQSLNYEYFDALDALRKSTDRRKVMLFLGSNIGNFNRERASSFLREVSDYMNQDDLFLVGLDLKKDPFTILKAYNDSEGFTSRFNLNLLVRINRELKANFNTDRFIHYPLYDPVSGTAFSYLISTEDQTVTIGETGDSIEFGKWEPIHTEISQKYDLKELGHLASENGFSLEQNFLDEKSYFVDSLWRKSPD